MKTPAFVVDASAIQRNMQILHQVKARTQCRILLALKAFSTWPLFHLMQEWLDGCCASSVHEARLAYEEFGKEVHVFAAAFSEADIQKIAPLANYITLNSLTQWQLFQQVTGNRYPNLRCGLRINPEHSEGTTPLYDPCAPNSRLGTRVAALAGHTLSGLTGLHMHTLCEQNAAPFVRTLTAFETRFQHILPTIKWINFGGGHHITRSDYDIDLLCTTLQNFRERHPHITSIYLEPGEACVLNAGTLVTRVLDIVPNQIPVAILDASCTCHLPDVLEMPYRPRVFQDNTWDGSPTPRPDADQGCEPGQKPHTFELAGASCLAGDIIGQWSFDKPLAPGDLLVFEDMAHYTMVKTNTFNGIGLPDIVLRRTDGTFQTLRRFDYHDFRNRLG